MHSAWSDQSWQLIFSTPGNPNLPAYDSSYYGNLRLSVCVESVWLDCPPCRVATAFTRDIQLELLPRLKTRTYNAFDYPFISTFVLCISTTHRVAPRVLPLKCSRQARLRLQLRWKVELAPRWAPRRRQRFLSSPQQQERTQAGPPRQRLRPLWARQKRGQRRQLGSRLPSRQQAQEPWVEQAPP